MENPGNAVAVVAPSDADIEAFEKFRKMGAIAVAHRKEVQQIQKLLDGTEWGRALSPQAKAGMAEWCRIMQIDPQRHVDPQGGKYFLNSNFWSDKINTDPYFHHYEQRDLSRRVEDALRARADTLRKRAEAIPAESARYLALAYSCEDEADQLAMDRAKSGAPPTAVAVTETTIWRFINAAPLDAIRAGQITDISQYIVPVVDYGWAGGREAEIDAYAKASGKTREMATKTIRPDPIGDANPYKTADTRSLRRTASKAFSAWMVRYQAQVEKMESILEADFTVVEDNGPPALTTGTGEPTVAPAAVAVPLPVHGEPEQETPEVEPEPVPVQPATPAWDKSDAHKRLFATLKDCGIADKDRKRWARDNGLPDTTKEWTKEHYDTAQELLVGPIRDEVTKFAKEQGVSIPDLALTVIGRETPEYAKHWIALLAALKGAGAEGDL